MVAPTESVRYTEKMNVTNTALNAAEPQSHKAHAVFIPESVSGGEALGAVKR